MSGTDESEYMEMKMKMAIDCIDKDMNKQASQHIRQALQAMQAERYIRQRRRSRLQKFWRLVRGEP